VDLGTLGRRGEVARAGIVARFIKEDLEHRRRIGAHAREDRVEPKYHPRLTRALTAH
jgi:hypothetical protein